MVVGHALGLGGWDSAHSSNPQVACDWQAGPRSYSPCRFQSLRDSTAGWTTSHRPLRCLSYRWSGARKDIESPCWWVFRVQNQIIVIAENPDTVTVSESARNTVTPCVTSWSASYRLEALDWSPPSQCERPWFHPQHQMKYKCMN